jgi:hypothetical protein
MGLSSTTIHTPHCVLPRPRGNNSHFHWSCRHIIFKIHSDVWCSVCIFSVSLVRLRKMGRSMDRSYYGLNPKLDSRKRSTSTFGTVRTHIHVITTRESNNDVGWCFFSQNCVVRRTMVRRSSGYLRTVQIQTTTVLLINFTSLFIDAFVSSGVIIPFILSSKTLKTTE